MKSNKKKARRKALESRKNTIRAFHDYIQHEAKDRPQYIAKFFSLWEGVAHDVAYIAEEFLEYPYIDLTKELWSNLLVTYSPIQLMRFTPLMDHLELEEEERYLAACTRLNQAWQQLFSTILVRHPDATALVARLETARQNTHDAVVPLFTGEAPAVLTPEWANGYTALEKAHPELAEALLK